MIRRRFACIQHNLNLSFGISQLWLRNVFWDRQYRLLDRLMIPEHIYCFAKLYLAGKHCIRSFLHKRNLEWRRYFVVRQIQVLNCSWRIEGFNLVINIRMDNKLPWTISKVSLRKVCIRFMKHNQCILEFSLECSLRACSNQNHRHIRCSPIQKCFYSLELGKFPFICSIWMERGTLFTDNFSMRLRRIRLCRVQIRPHIFHTNIRIRSWHNHCIHWFLEHRFHWEVWNSLSKWYIYFRFFTSILEVWYQCIPCHLDSKRAQERIFCIIHWSRIQHNIYWLNWAEIGTSHFSWHNCIHRLRIQSLTYKSGNPQCM